LEEYLDSSKGAAGFDYWLAKAFLGGARKDVAGAYSSLQKAFRQRTSSDNDNRPALTEFQYAQACEWLYRETGDSRFMTELLEWVKRYEVIVPTQGWAYAMEYSYEKPGPARTRALAMARYLDSASERIRGASAEEARTADSWFRENNPFRVQATESGLRQTVAAR
jgi:hypothetical protein